MPTNLKKALRRRPTAAPDERLLFDIGKQMGNNAMAIADIFKAILAFDAAQAKSLTQTEIDAGREIETLLNEGLINFQINMGD